MRSLVRVFGITKTINTGLFLNATQPLSTTRTKKYTKKQKLSFIETQATQATEPQATEPQATQATQTNVITRPVEKKIEFNLEFDTKQKEIQFKVEPFDVKFDKHGLSIKRHTEKNSGKEYIAGYHFTIFGMEFTDNQIRRLLCLIGAVAILKLFKDGDSFLVILLINFATFCAAMLIAGAG